MSRIFSVDPSSGPFTPRAPQTAFQYKRFLFLTAAFALGFAGLVIRLYQLQIVRGEALLTRSEQNFIQQRRLIAARGIIYDAQHRVIVDNRAALDLYGTRAFIPDVKRSLGQLRGYLNMDDDEYNFIERRLTHQANKLQSVLIRRDLTRDQLELIESDRAVGKLAGFNVVDSGMRHYREGALLAHVTGYLNEITAAELEQKHPAADDTYHYEMGDIIGRRGIERTFESYLRGENGHEDVVVDAKGRKQDEELTRELLGDQRHVPATAGNHLVLSIDLEVQRAAQKAFTGQAGVVVVVEIHTGAILALYSAPAYDPNSVSGKLAADEKLRLDSNPLKPWINRAVQEHYAPGSTYKSFTALTALKRGILTPDTPITCTGSYRSGHNVWRCFNERGHGSITLHRSLVMSCDAFYYTLGARLGIEPLAETARAFGFGMPTGIELEREIPGIVPDVAFHNWAQRKEGGYRPGFAINTAVGQGANAFTPLQLVMAYAAIANGGTLYKPQLVKQIEDAEGRIVKIFEPIAKNQVPFTPEQLAAVKSGLCGVVSERGGTAFGKGLPDLDVCGKTGTAQVVKLGKNRQDARVAAYQLRDHAWFVGYAPAQEPQVAAVVITEHGGFGGNASAPTVMAVLNAAMKRGKSADAAKPTP